MSKSATLLNTEFRTYEPGEHIFTEGDPGNVMYSVIEGKVEIRTNDKIVYTVDQGEVFGEMALIDDKPRSATAVAKTNCRLAVIDSRRYNFLIQQTPLFITQIMKALTNRLRHMNQDLNS